MAKQLNAEQKTISQVFMECKKAFLIPEYQRPYSWERDECLTLWNNLYEFAFPNDTITDFDADEDNYFMGTILFFKNRSKEYELIDGQQRIVTFMLMLRAFYESFGSAQDENIKNIRRKIESCIWKVDEDEKPKIENPKLKYEVITDEDANELKKILTTGKPTDKNKSNYAVNYRLFKRWIEDLNSEKTGYLLHFARRILNNCVLLPIETDSQNTALRIFTTLNDRGRPLDDADIFKAQFYKYYLNRGSDEKDKFVERWKDLTELCNKNFHPRKDTPVDDLFRRYMYYLMARAEIKNDTFPDMRDYYEKNSYEVLQSDKTFCELEILEERFSPRVLRQIYVLSWAPYNIWAYVVSIYFMGNRELEEEKFFNFLNKITAMLLMYAITNPGVQSIRRPFFIEFGNILHGRPLEFKHFRQDEKILRERINQIKFSNQRAITGAMLAWWTFQNPAQDLPPLGVELQIEHILPRKRQELHNVLKNPDALEFLGNKSLLEKSVNIRAADYRLVDKKIFYLGDGKKPATFNLELRYLAEMHDDFTEDDINARNEEIFKVFVEYLQEQNLLV